MILHKKIKRQLFINKYLVKDKNKIIKRVMEERFIQIEKKVKRKELKQNLLLLIISIVIILILIEIALRLFGYPVYGFQKWVFISDDSFGYKLAPNYSGVQSVYGRSYFLESNSQGLRDNREYSYEKPPGTKRIILLGDSITFGNGVDLNDSYAEMLRNKFSQSNQKVEVINLGIPGYGINNEYVRFIDEGIKYDPDIVIIQYTPNDWRTHQLSIENGKTIVDKDYTTTANEKGLLVSYREKFSARSIHLFLLFNFRSYSLFYTKSRQVLSGVIDKYWANRLGSGSVPLYFRDKNSEIYKESYDGYKAVVEMMQNKTNSTIIVFIGPFRQNLNSPEKLKEIYNLSYDPDPRQTQKDVEKIAKELDIPSIVLTSNDSNIYIPVDGHWNEKGNELVADKLYSELQKYLK